MPLTSRIYGSALSGFYCSVSCFLVDHGNLGTHRTVAENVVRAAAKTTALRGPVGMALEEPSRLRNFPTCSLMSLLYSILIRAHAEHRRMEQRSLSLSLSWCLLSSVCEQKAIRDMI